MQFGDAVLVVERNGRPILDRLAEIIDRDVIAEHLAGLLLARHQGSAGEADERGIGQRAAHVRCQHVILAAVRFVRHDDDVIAL